MHRLRSLLRPSVVAVAAALVFLLAYSVDTRAFSLDVRRWPTAINTYRLDPNYSNRGTGLVWENIAHQAASDWTVATNIDFGHDPGSPNRIMSDLLPVTKLAELRPYYVPWEPYYVTYDIAVTTRASYNFYDGTQNPWPANYYDLATVLRHEFGHAVGLGHSATEGYLMHAELSPNQVRGINPDAQRGVNYLYLGSRADIPRREAENTFYTAGIADSASQAVGYAYNGWVNGPYCPYCTFSTRAYSNHQGATTWFAFQGNRVTWQFSKQPSRGQVEVYLDGSLLWLPNLYSLQPIWGAMRSFDVAHGNHIIEVRKSDASSAIYMDTDAFFVDIARAPSSSGGTFHDDYYNGGYVRWNTDPALAGWQVSTTAAGAYMTTTTYSSIVDSSLSFTFEGNRIKYWFTKRNDRGIARITIDGEDQGTVDHYGPYPNGLRRQESPPYQLSTTGTHTLVITVSGQKHPDSLNHVVDVDGFTVYR